MKRPRSVLSLVSVAAVASFGACAPPAPIAPVAAPPAVSSSAPIAPPDVPLAPLPPAGRVFIDRPAPGPIRTAAMSSDGKVLAFPADDDAVRFVELRGGAPHAPITTTGLASFEGVSLDATGATVSISESAGLRFVDRISGKTLQNYVSEARPMTLFAGRAGLRGVLVPTKGPALVVDLHTGKTLTQLPDFKPAPEDISFGPGDNMILFTTGDHTTRVLEATTGKLRAAFGGMGPTIRAWLTPDSATLFVLTADVLKAWDVLGRTALYEQHLPLAPLVAMSADGKRFATSTLAHGKGGDHVEVAVYDAVTTAQKKRFVTTFSDIAKLEFLDNGDVVVGATIAGNQFVVATLAMATGKSTVVATGSVYRSSSGGAIFVNSVNPIGTFRAIDATSGQDIGTIRGTATTDGRLMSAAWSDSGNRIATTTAKGIVRVHDVATGALVTSTAPTGTARTPTLWINADGSRVFRSDNAMLDAIDTEGNGTWSIPIGGEAVAIPRRGEVFVHAREALLSVASLADGSTIKQLDLTTPIRYLAIAPDGSRVSVLVTDHMIRTYALPTLFPIGDPVPASDLTRTWVLDDGGRIDVETGTKEKPAAVNHVDAAGISVPLLWNLALAHAIGKNGDAVAILEGDANTVHLWNGASSSVVPTPPGTYRDLELSPDGKLLALVGDDLVIQRLADNERARVAVVRTDDSTLSLVWQDGGAFDANDDARKLVRVLASGVVHADDETVASFARPGLLGRLVSGKSLPPSDPTRER